MKHLPTQSTLYSQTIFRNLVILLKSLKLICVSLTRFSMNTSWWGNIPYGLFCFLAYLRVFLIKDVFKLSLRILDKNCNFRSLFKHSFVKILLQWHSILAYIKLDLFDYTSPDFFSGKFWNFGMFKITLTENFLKSSANN